MKEKKYMKAAIINIRYTKAPSDRSGSEGAYILLKVDMIGVGADAHILIQ